MRPWRGIDSGTNTDPRIRESLSSISDFLFDVSAALGKVTAGEKPTASGGGQLGVTDHGALTGLGDDDHAQYLLLAGRGGQSIVDAITLTGSLLVANAATGTQPMRVNAITGTTASLFTVEKNASPYMTISNLGVTTLATSTTADMLVLPYSAGGTTFRTGTSGSSAVFSIVPSSTSMTWNLSHGLTWQSKGVTVRSSDAATVALAVSHANAPTANLQTWAGTGSVLAYVTKDGYFGGKRLQLDGATSGTLSLIPAATTTSHSLNLPSANASGALTNDGSGNLSWASAGASPHALLDGTQNNDTVAQAPSRGSLIYGNSTPAWDELTVGGSSTVLRSDGTDVSWGAIDKNYISNRQRHLFLRPADFSDTTSELGTAPDQIQYKTFSNTAGGNSTTTFVVPETLVSWDAITIYYSMSGTDVNTVDWTLYAKDLSGGGDVTAAYDNTEAKSLTPVGTTNYMSTGLFTASTVFSGMGAGALIRLVVARSNSDANANNASFHGLDILYTADM